MVTGILSILTVLTFPPITIVLGITSIILGIVGKKKGGKAMAIAGIITGVISILILALLIAFLVFAFSTGMA